MTQDISQLEIKYHQIAELYDMAEELVATVEHPHTQNPDEQLDLVEPLINQLGDSTDILCEEFIEVAGNKQSTPLRKSRIESALRKIYTALDAYQEHVTRVATSQATAMKNIADAIVEKIKLQVEQIICIFIDFIDLSLERIMNKHHVEEMRRRQEKIAMMLFAAEKRNGFELGA